MRILKDIQYVNSGAESQKLDIYLPEGEDFTTLIYFHGGGIVAGDKADDYVGIIAKHLAAKGYALCSANYRMYPSGAKFPDYVEDAAAAVAFIKKNIKKHGGSGKIFVGGSSAGGYLSMMLCYDERFLEQHSITPRDIAGFIHDAGQPTTHFNILRLERGLERYRVIIDEAAPLYHVESGKDYPPQLLLVADNDLPNRYEQTLLTLGTLKSLGHDMSRVEMKLMEGYSHVKYVSALDECGKSVFGKVLYEFMNKN